MRARPPPTAPQLLFAAADVLVAAQIADLARLCGGSPRRAWWAAAAWLYCPFTATISTRGSCDALIAAALLGALGGLLRGRRAAPAALYGLAVHLRIYPIIYAPAIVLFLARRSRQRQGGGGRGAASAKASAAEASPTTSDGLRWAAAVAREGALFGGLSGGLFLALGAACYRLYGQPFLHEAFLHHVGRRDPRHNFSPAYYPVYLQFMDYWPGGGASSGGASGGSGAPDVSRWAAAPQAALLLALAACLHDRLPLAWALLTWAFVAFNRVATAQYFVWFLALAPVALANVAWPPPRRLLAAGAAWVAAQLHWLAWAYALEFRGAPVHLALWGASVAFLAANAAAMVALMHACRDAGGGGGGEEARAARGRQRAGSSTPGSRSASRSRSRPRVADAAAATPAGVRRSSRIAAAAHGATPGVG